MEIDVDKKIRRAKVLIAYKFIFDRWWFHAKFFNALLIYYGTLPEFELPCTIKLKVDVVSKIEKIPFRAKFKVESPKITNAFIVT